MYKRFHHGITLVAKSFDIDLTVLTQKWEQIYLSRSQTRGKESAVKFCKELNTVCERYALRQTITPIPWTKSDKDGFPKCLGAKFKSFLRSSDTRKVVLALSVMRSCESLRLPISKDISTVTAPCKADTDLIDDILGFTSQWVSVLQTVSLRRLKYHYTVKNGPNGHALHTSDTDLSTVMADPKLWGAILTISDKLKNKTLAKANVDTSQQGLHSKLIQFPDKSGKTRTVAIVDYYSQRCLKPLHNMLMEILSSLVSDGTYSHQNVGKFAQLKTKEKSFIYCADLTAFTDRFPAIIQRKLLFELLKDDDLSQAFWTLLAERSFTVAWSGELVSYSCGQPMGAYASWALCSLAHHLVIEYCGYKVGKPAKYHYKQIGDDTIITEPAIAQKYQEVITALGVDISLSKTVLSSALSDYSGAEVAKQLYLNGKCLTPLTPGFVQNLRKPYMFNTCLEVLRGRYDFIRPETLSMFIDLFYRKGKQKDKVWLLCSNPISGTIKPGYPGYNEYSPWISKNLDKSTDDYYKIIIRLLADKAMRFIDSEMEFMFSGESPWKGSKPPPHCLKYIKSDISSQLTKITKSLGDVSVGADLGKIVEEFSFVPDPLTPYMERKELRQKRMSSVIQSLYDYNDEITFVQLDW